MAENLGKFSKNSPYALFYFLSTVITAAIVAVVVLVLQLSEVYQAPDRANIVVMFLMFQAYALLMALVVVGPTGLIGRPIWKVTNKKLIASGRSPRQAAALAALPLGWIGIHLCMAALAAMNGNFWQGLFGLNYPVELGLLGIGSVVGPTVAWVIYRDE